MAVGILAGSHRFSVRVGREVQEIGFHAARRRAATGVGVNGQEQIGAFAIRDRRALLERNERIRASRQYHVDARLLLQDLLHALRDVEHQIRLDQPVRLRAGVVPAVPRIDHDA